MEAERLRKSLDNRRENAQRLQTQLASYKARIEVAPKLESELTELTRDYNTLEKQYLDLLRKSEESKIAVNLERRQIGEQFKVIDTAQAAGASLEARTACSMNLVGLFAGLGLGLALVALLEYRDTTFEDRRRRRHQPGAAGACRHPGDDYDDRTPADQAETPAAGHVHFV